MATKTFHPSETLKISPNWYNILKYVAVSIPYHLSLSNNFPIA